MFSEYIRMFVLTFLIVNIIKTEKDLKQISLVLVSLITFLVLYAYHRYKTEGFPIALPSVYYVDRNYFAESIVAILPLAFVFYEENVNKLKKLFFLGVTAAMIAGVILTHSRGGLLALLIVLLFLFLQSRKKFVMIIFGIVILTLFMPHIGKKYRARMATIKTYEEDPSAKVRIATWKAGINMIKHHPFLGVGAGNYNDLFVYYVRGGFAGERKEISKLAYSRMSIHNIFLQIASETGLIGGGLFLLAIFNCFMGLHILNRRNNQLPEQKQLNIALPKALGVSLLGFCGAGFFLPGAYYGYLYIILALIIASRKIYTQRIDEAKK